MQVYMTLCLLIILLVGTTLDPSNAKYPRYYNRVGTLMYSGNPVQMYKQMVLLMVL